MPRLGDAALGGVGAARRGDLTPMMVELLRRNALVARSSLVSTDCGASHRTGLGAGPAADVDVDVVELPPQGPGRGETSAGGGESTERGGVRALDVVR